MRRRGFTLIELLVVICVVAVIFSVALDRLLRYQELGERAAVEQNLAAINVGLTMKFAALVTSGRADLVRDEVGANPVNVLARPPENYLGELQAPEIAALPRGSWHFDTRSRDFVYVPARARFLTTEQGLPMGNLRFRVMLTNTTVEPGAPKVLAQPYLGAVPPFRWAID